MDAKTIEATQGSWRKWDRIARGKGVDNGADNCPLCKLFHDAGCVGCPIAAATGEKECHGTPYYQYRDVQDDDELSPQIARTAAKVMRNFINLLLPEKHRMPKKKD